MKNDNRMRPLEEKMNFTESLGVFEKFSNFPGFAVLPYCSKDFGAYLIQNNGSHILLTRTRVRFEFYGSGSALQNFHGSGSDL